jgi:Dodecin
LPQLADISQASISPTGDGFCLRPSAALQDEGTTAPVGRSLLAHHYLGIGTGSSALDSSRIGFQTIDDREAIMSKSPRGKLARRATTGGTGRDGAVDFAAKEDYLGEQAAHGGHVYRVIEIVDTSEDGIEAAINAALARAHRTIRNLRWF